MADQKATVTKEPQSAEAELPKGKKGKKGFIILMGGLFILLLAVGSVFFFAPSLLPPGINPFNKGGELKAEKTSKPTPPGHLYNLDSMIVNLADTEFPRYLKIKIDLESEQSKPSEEFDKRLPQLKDAILTILTSKTYADIIESEGKIQLKEEITQKANQLFETVKVKAVYFTEFVVQ